MKIGAGSSKPLLYLAVVLLVIVLFLCALTLDETDSGFARQGTFVLKSEFVSGNGEGISLKLLETGAADDQWTEAEVFLKMLAFGLLLLLFIPVCKGIWGQILKLHFFSKNHSTISSFSFVNGKHAPPTALRQ